MHALWNIYFDICKWNAWESMALHKAEFVIKFAIRLPPPPTPGPIATDCRVNSVVVDHC